MLSSCSSYPSFSSHKLHESYFPSLFNLSFEVIVRNYTDFSYLKEIIPLDIFELLEKTKKEKGFNEVIVYRSMTNLIDFYVSKGYNLKSLLSQVLKQRTSM